MRKKIFTLLTLMLAVCSGAWAAVTDLAFTATKTVTAGGEIWWTTSENVATANSAGWCSNNENGNKKKYANITPSLSGDTNGNSGSYTINANEGVLVKGGNTPSDLTTSKKGLVFKVTNTTEITVYGATTTSSSEDYGYLRWSIYDASDNSAVVSSAYGDGALVNNTCKITKNGLNASKTYIVSIEGGYKDTSGNNQDCVIYAIKFAAPNAGAPTINTQPVSAFYELGDDISALTVNATPSAGDLSYQWYSCVDANKTNPQEVGTNSASYTPSSPGYYYCKVSDDNGNTDSNVASITVVNAFTPSISFSDSKVTLVYGGSGTVYYTTDGSEPSSSNGTQYDGTPFSLTNSCTVRAIAKKGENYSDIAKYDCYVTHDGVLTMISENSGTKSNSDKTWASNDGLFTMTLSSNNEGHSIAQAVGFNGNDALKLNHGDTYTIQPDNDVKVTKIVIVGSTWLQGDAGNAATVAFSGFTPASGTFYDYTSERYIKTIEFTSSTHNYGDPITMTPSNNQIGAYIEVYGVKRSGPAEPEAVFGTAVTWDFTSSASDVNFTDGNSYSYIADDDSSEMRYTAGSSDKISANNYLKENGTTSSNEKYKDTDGVTSVGKSRLIRLFVTGKGTLKINCTANNGVYNVYESNATKTAASGSALISSFSANTTSSLLTVENGLWIETTTKGYITSVVWTPISDDITLTTSDNMAGWRAFYDADNGYTLDGNTKAYIATEQDGDAIKLKAIERGIPAATPVILYTTSSADSHKMTLAKASVAAYNEGTDGTNLLQYTTSAVSNKYRLGYGESGVGFYPYSGTPTSGAVILNVDASARALSIVFDEEETGIKKIENAASGKENGAYFNLAGQRVAQPTKGLYIVNGKKVVIK